jgi:predicted transcriptional regulator
MATQNSIHVSDELLAALEAKAAAEGTTVDALAEDALRRHLAQRTLDRLTGERDRRRGRMSDAEVEETVERAVSQVRGR